MMNSSQAKSIPINNYLLSLGIIHTKIKGQNYWYSSPFREDKEASFKVDSQKNIWYDFGIGKGGNILELVMLLNSCNFTEALKIIESKNFNYEFNEQNVPVLSSFDQQTENFSLMPLQSSALLQYLSKRGIEIAIAKKYCCEAHYTIKNKNYYGIAFKNDSGGYEIRNSYAKINLYGKDITTIVKSETTVNVFEGFIDFLSYLVTHRNAEQESNIILNGVGMVERSVNILNKFSNVLLFLDNDQSGREATKYLMNNLIKASDMSLVYTGFKDFNEYLLVKRKNNRS